MSTVQDRIGATTGIEWTQRTWNPLAGCSMCSPGCARCYAETMAKRLRAMAEKDLADGKEPGRKRHYLEVIGDNGRWNGRIALIPEALDEPLRRKQPTTWFVNSMSDLFHEGVPFEFIARVYAVMAMAYWHTFQILTKRPERAAEVTPDLHLAMTRQMVNFQDYVKPVGPWPLPNVWLGTSVEDQKRADQRIPHLLRCPAAVRFLSCEPLLGPVDLLQVASGVLCPDPSHRIDVLRGGTWNLGGGFTNHSDMPGTIDWVIVGGESGPGARPCNVGWIRSIVGQCRDAGVACFVKQLGAVPVMPTDEWRRLSDAGPAPLLDHRRHRELESQGFVRLHLPDSKGGNPDEWREDLRVRQFPKPEARR